MPAFDKRDFYRELGLLLSRHRKARGITQEELSSALQMPRSSYANIERGRQRAPADVVWRAALYMGLKVDELLPRPIARRPEEPTPSGTATGIPFFGLSSD